MDGEEFTEVDRWNSGEINFASSKETFDDPELDTVLRWHISQCPWCQSVLEVRMVVAFGKRSPMCPEYLEIIEEYAEYEGKYAWLANP